MKIDENYTFSTRGVYLKWKNGLMDILIMSEFSFSIGRTHDLHYIGLTEPKKMKGPKSPDTGEIVTLHHIHPDEIHSEDRITGF